MTKPRDIVKRIQKEARRQGLDFEFYREGARHTVYDLDGLHIPIARHGDIANVMAEVIYKECEPKLGKRWWK